MTGNMTSLDIDFPLIYLLPYYLHHLDGATSLSGKTLYVPLNVCDSEDCLLVEAWNLPPLSTTVGGEVEKPVGCNGPPPFVKKDVSFLIG